MTILIGVTGRARVGKDSFASACVKRGFVRLAFADALKVATAYLAHEDAQLFFDDVTKEEHCEVLGMTRRRALQNVGKALREAVGPDIWINRALSDWDRRGKPDTVISDVRYENEADAIRRLGGTVVRINRAGAGLAGEAGQHESEKPLPDYLIDIEIDNDGTLGELQWEARKIVDILRSNE